MPIAGISDVVRLPRLGKIKLGIKQEGDRGPYPVATDYFVCPPEVQEVYGDKPKQLDIMFPLDDENLVAPQWLRCYSQSRGCVCWGDGRTANRLIDKATGDLASGDSREVTMKPVTCDPEPCPEYQSKRCRRLMNLQLLLPRVAGLGVWQLNTSSRNSIYNINGMLRTIRAVCGRIAMLPLFLCLEPCEVSPLGEKKTARVLVLRANMPLAAMQRLGAVEPTRILLPPPDLGTDEDLYPQEVLEVEGNTPESSPSERRGVDDLFPPVLTEAEEREACWEEILSAREKTDVSIEQMLKWFRQRQVSLSSEALVGRKPPQAVSLDTLRLLRDNLRSYQAKMGL